MHNSNNGQALKDLSKIEHQDLQTRTSADQEVEALALDYQHTPQYNGIMDEIYMLEHKIRQVLSTQKTPMKLGKALKRIDPTISSDLIKSLGFLWNPESKSFNVELITDKLSFRAAYMDCHSCMSENYSNIARTAEFYLSQGYRLLAAWKVDPEDGDRYIARALEGDGRIYSIYGEYHFALRDLYRYVTAERNTSLKPRNQSLFKPGFFRWDGMPLRKLLIKNKYDRFWHCGLSQGITESRAFGPYIDY